METQRHPNEPVKPTATGQEGGQQGGGSQERDPNKERDRDKQGGGSQERERELQQCKIEVTKLSANLINTGYEQSDMHDGKDPFNQTKGQT
jgi:hypothetical protein